MIVCRDISYRKKIEVELISAKNKAEENDRLKTAFLHNISHEIRTPLNAIIGFSSLLGDPMITRDQQQSFFEIIKKSSDHLLSIISDIVEISNIDADIITVNENDVDLNDIIKDLFDQYLPLCEKKNIQLMYSFGVRDEKVIIRSDKTKLVQILSNLLSNSLRFTDTGIISFGYYVEQNTLRFCVSDTGKGVPEDECHKIFDRFYQIKPSEERIYEGTGLGLSICKAYVELLGGHIGVTSTVGKGSVFHFSIPFKRVKAPSRINENIDMKGPGRFPG